MAAQRKEGVITNWNDSKGFGFIRPSEGGKDVFFHVSDLADTQIRPGKDFHVSYVLSQDANNKPKAMQVRFAPGQRSAVSLMPSRVVGVALLLAVTFLIALGVLAFFGVVPSWLPLVYLVMSAITFGFYANDKNRAQQAGQRRIPEANLHLLEFCCGWPGALLAQQYYRHKTQKESFRSAYRMAVAANLALLIIWVALRLFVFPSGL